MLRYIISRLIHQFTPMKRQQHKAKIQNRLSALVFVIGIILLTLKIHADSEPGAISLLLIVLGSQQTRRSVPTL